MAAALRWFAVPAAPHDHTTAGPTGSRGSAGSAGGVVGRVAAVLPWLLRAAWVVLPFTAGTVVGDGLAGASRPVSVTGTVLAWVVWGLTMLATLVPHPVSLTVLRIATPLATAVSVWGVTAGHASAGRAVLALVPVVVALVLAYWAETGHWAVNGPAYPNERRFLLRAPGMLLLGPLEIAWALVCAGALAGPLLLAAKAWVVGGILLVAGWAVVFVLFRSLHALARRFVVFVPAGFVLHDLMSLRDPVLFQRQKVEAIRPAPAGTDSLDLTQNSPGLAIEVLLLEKTEVTLLHRGGREGEVGKTARFLFTPTLPGRLLAEARSRHLRTS